jgi:dTDP-4-amino-4,6-dideoxygalactose transaminase
LSDILAALLYSQLLSFNKIQSKRELLWNNYFNQLSNWSRANGVQLPVVPEYCEQTFHMFFMLFPNNQVRTAFIKYLADNNIVSVFHYLPLDSSSMGAAIKLDDQTDCTKSKEVSQCIVRLPLFFDLNLKDQEEVINTVTQFKV